MSNIRRYITIGLVYLFFNLFIFIFWWVVTDPGNYIWFSIPSEKRFLLEAACSKLFLIKYYKWTVILNGLLTVLFLFQIKRLVALFIICCLPIFYLSCSVVFDSYIGKNYYSIFLNQVVSPDFMLEPVNDAGKSIGPYLLENINKNAGQRLYAARGLGDIQYIAAIEKLAQILEDTSETIFIRTECFNALKKMKVPESRAELEKFSLMHEEGKSSDSLLLQTIRQTESNDLY